MKWEYQCSPIPPIDGALKNTDDGALEDAESALNTLGHDGWELVSIILNSGKDGLWNIAVLKRPLSN